MSQQSRAHDYLEWAKQKLDEIEATLVSFDNAARTLKNDARAEADLAVVRIRATRDAFKASVDDLRANAAAVREAAGNTYASLGAEWDAAIRRLAVETEKAKAKFGKASGVGDESWKAVKSGLEEAISIYDRTWKKISEAIAKGR
jgi:prefoldin subunit 5